MDESRKDPAFLFYSSDFLIDTLLWDDIEVGRWIKLMCFFHQKGHLSRDAILNIVKDENSVIFTKLKIDEKGLYYNERLEFEIEKRKAYSESRRNNRKNICKTYVEHMGNEIVIENVNEYIIKNNYSNDLKDTIINWLNYKVERKENYKEQGFKSLLTQIKNNIEKYNEKNVIQIISECMASNYKGIIFEKLEKKPKKQIKQEEVPEWFDKDLKNEEMTKEDEEELDDILNSIEEKISNIGG